MNSLNSFWNVIFSNLKHFNLAKIFNHYDKHSAIEIFLYLTLPLGILMPFFEELIYRGLIYRSLKEYFNRLTAMLLLSFSLAILRYAHIIARDPRLLSPTYEEKVFAGISALLHSFMMIYTYEKTKNFWTIVIISIVNSLITYHFTEHIFVVIGLICIFASIVLLCHRLLTKNKTLTK
ncbi:MAG: CPBP family intramembrane metalloprotease [Treponemataceae bacterium]